MKKFKRPDPKRGDGHRPRASHMSGGRPTHTPPSGRPVIGIHAVSELLKVRPRAVTQLWLRDKYGDHPALEIIAEQAQKAGVRVQSQPVGALDKVTSNHQGVVAFASAEPELDWRQVESSQSMTLIALDEVEDPHNLGAVLRTAWLLGASAVLTPEHRAAQLSPAVSKVAQGAVEHVPVVRDSALPQQLEELKKHGFWILGLSHEAKQSLFTLDVPPKVVWVLGSEATGLRKSVAGMCDDLIAIPQSAPGASYNVSVAAAIAMAETFRQRSLPPN
jgi:23S rRNA (guanosine2251-2'-O)-methyltransferase